MTTQQHSFIVRTPGRGSLEISADVAEIVAASGLAAGVSHVFVRHTSCGLAITENADASVRDDLETLFAWWAPDGDPAYRHDLEGDDDMAAHARAILTGCSVSVPFSDGRLLLGSWQGIYLFEHRTGGHRREVVVTLLA